MASDAADDERGLMRLDSANRSFGALVISSLLLGVYVLCGAVGCVLIPLIVSRASHHGISGLVDGSRNLLPAVAFVVLVGGGVALGVRSLWRQIAASRVLARRVRSLALDMPDELARAATAAGLAGRMVLVDSPELFSFAYGALTPQVAVSLGLLEGVSVDELRAVLEHERYHVRNLDPLKVLIVRALPATFFFLPALGALRARYVAGRELAADRRAVQVCGRKPLVVALMKVVRGPAWGELEVAAAIGGPELLDLRVAQLESGQEPKIAVLDPMKLALSVLGALVFAGAFIASVVSFGGPSAVSQATGMGMSVGDVLGGAMCAVPFAVGALLVYRWIAWRAREPLTGPPQSTTLL
jgi:Zn-dependent protease with chaperone function